MQTPRPNTLASLALLLAAATAALQACAPTTRTAFDPADPVETTDATLPQHIGRSIDARLNALRNFRGFETTTIVCEIPDASAALTPIQSAIDSLPPAGGTVVLPAGDLLINAPIRIIRSNVRLIGQGERRTTIRFAPGAMRGLILDCIEIKGPSPTNPIRNIHIAGLTIDANYWNQPGSYNPRAIDTDNATDILIEQATITRAFVGLTFGLGVNRATAHRVTINNWHNDAFNASGDGITAGASDILFHRCTAENSLNERRGGPPGNRNNAWEIEDGAADVTLIDCTVQNASGNGFAVRNHSLDEPCTTSDITFINCNARNIDNNAFHVIGRPHPNNIENITLLGCRTDSVSSFTKGIRGLSIRDSNLDATVSIGPASDATIARSTLRHLTLWSFPVTVNNNEQASYETSLTIIDSRIRGQLSVLGELSGLTLQDTEIPENSNIPTAAEPTL